MRYVYPFLTGLALFCLAGLTQAQPVPQVAQQFLDANHLALRLTETDVTDVVLSSSYTSAHNGISHYYLLQRHNGIEVYNGILNVHVRDGEVVHYGSRFVSDLARKVANQTAPALQAASAVESAARAAGLTLTEPLQVQASKSDREVVLSRGGIAAEPIEAKLVYQPLEDGSVRLAWQTGIYTQDRQHYWNTRVDALTGAVLAQDDMVIKDHWGGIPVVSDARPDVTWTTPPPYRPLQERITTLPPMATSAAMMGMYRVYPSPVESPIDDSDMDPETDNRTLEAGPQPAATAESAAISPFGWQNDGTTAYLITKGNNVHAYVDSIAAGTEIGPSPTETSPGTFDYPADFTKKPSNYTDAAVVNLFYWNNLMHDVLYQYGFTEPAGNMQQDNNSNGGMDSDAVLAQAQDAGGFNNANMLTLQDGTPPRMQMFLWTPSVISELLTINSPGSIAGMYASVEAAFGAEIDGTGTTADLLLADANSMAVGADSEGCGFIESPPAGATPLPYDNAVAMIGKIAVVDRGSCSFVEKALTAQLSGAVGIIVINNVPGEPIAMGGTGGEAVTIPAIMISMADGTLIKNTLASVAAQKSQAVVNGTIVRSTPAPVMRDGDFDNGIIAHEYGHSVSSRLTGGPNQTCLGGDEQGGEGWSDYYGLMLTMKAADIADGGMKGRGIGNYVRYKTINGPGIRPAPYSIDTALNNFTYGDVPGVSVPHGVGFIWATMLWDMTWKFIDRYGFDANLYDADSGHGNKRALQLIQDGIAMQPCSPTFVDQRDAIIAALQAGITAGDYDQQDLCNTWEAFAGRGLGANVVELSAENDFSVPAICLGAASLDLKKDVEVLSPNPATAPDPSAGDVATVTLTGFNISTSAITGAVITDLLPDNTRYVESSATCGGTFAGGVVTFSGLSVPADGSVECSYQYRISGVLHSPITFSDDMETDSGNWASTSTGASTGWTRQPGMANSGAQAWFSEDAATDGQGILTQTGEITLPSSALAKNGAITGTPALTFWHAYDTEVGFDGGTVEISTDNGSTWSDLGTRMVKNPYNGSFFNGCSGPVSGGGLDPVCTAEFIQTRVDLRDFAGQNVKVRFIMTSDLLVPGVGWWVDDVSYVDLACAGSTATFAAPSFSDATAFGEVCVVNQEPVPAFTSTGKVYLSGAYDDTADMMTTDLNTKSLLPLNQPYSDAIFDGTDREYDGTESVPADFFTNNPDVVDWVLLEVRTGTEANTKEETRVGFVQKDGSLLDVNANPGIPFFDVDLANAYLIVRHRNHLPVMTPTAIAINTQQLTHDFTTAQAQAFGTNPMRQVDSSPTAFGLRSSDGNIDGQVTVFDFLLVWLPENGGPMDYEQADFNMTGDVTAFDFLQHWLADTGQETQFPEN